MPNDLSSALLNGQVISLEHAQISLTHPVFTSSFGVYETIQIDQGRPFHLYNHLERLGISAALVGINLPAIETLYAWGKLLISKLPPISYTLQVLAIGQALPTTQTIVTMFPRPTPTYPTSYFETGAEAITIEGQRTLPQCKSFNTLMNHLARVAAHKANAVEAILIHNNKLLEGARSNLFVVEATTNRLLTPPTETVLSGITRDIVIQLMQDSRFPVCEDDIFLDTPKSEMFLTSTSMHVLPITKLDGKPLGTGYVGPVTRLVMTGFHKYYTNILE